MQSTFSLYLVPSRALLLGIGEVALPVALPVIGLTAYSEVVRL